MHCIAGFLCGVVRPSPGGKIEKIVVAGGQHHRNTGEPIDVVEVYDIASDSWETGH